MEEISIRIGDAEIKIFCFSKDFSYRKEWDSSAHFHVYHEIHLIKSGYVSLVADKTHLDIKSGDVCLLSPQVNHYTEEYSDDLLMFSILFNMTKLYDKSKNADDFSEFSYYSGILESNKGCTIVNRAKIFDIFEEINACGKSKEKSHIVKILFALFFVEFFDGLKKNQNNKNFEITDGYESDEVARQKHITEGFFQWKYTERITIKDLADELNLSVSQTGRIVKKFFGMGFKKVLLKQRIESACMLINKSNMSLGTIAEKSGYLSYNGFFFAFKTYTGMTPEEYKNRRT